MKALEGACGNTDGASLYFQQIGGQCLLQYWKLVFTVDLGECRETASFFLG